MRDNFPSSSVHNSDTFIKEVEQIGVICPDKRQELYNKNKSRVVDIYFRDVAEKMKELYGMDLESWDSNEDQEGFVQFLQNEIDELD